jgi:hypothetical protein
MTEYKSANNNYSPFEHTIEKMLERQTDEFDFLSNSTTLSIFGVDNDWGETYIHFLLNEFPEFVKNVQDGMYTSLFDLFHSIGSPKLFYSDIMNGFTNANTIRYIYHALLIKKYMKEKFPSTKLQVVEIGGGYGGLCFWLSVVAPECIQTYEICDLKIVGCLQKRCLDKWNIACSYFNSPSEWKKSEYPTFVISNYAYSEFNSFYQDLYKDTILKNAEAGFMIWNNWTGIYKFTELPLTIEKERPSFAQNLNLFLYF